MLQLRRRNIPLFAILFAVRAVSGTVLRSSWDCASLANPQFGGLLFRLPARRGWQPLEFRLVRANVIIRRCLTGPLRKACAIRFSHSSRADSRFSSSGQEIQSRGSKFTPAGQLAYRGACSLAWPTVVGAKAQKFFAPKRTK
jgi:hypothetical protein